MALASDNVSGFFGGFFLQAPLPKPWKPCQDAMTNEMYYFNFETEESSWEHPADMIYKDKAAIAMNARLL